MAKQSNVDTPSTQDEQDSGNFLTNNVRMLGIAGLLIVIIIGGVWYYNQSQSDANASASLALSRIRPYYDRGEYDVAIAGDSSKSINGEKIRGLRSIVDEHGSTEAGKVAALLLGSAYLATDQVAKAAEPFSLATESKEGLVSAPAHAGLGAVAEAAGKYEEAAKEYEKAATDDRMELNTPQYLLSAGRNYEHAKQNDAAKENYRKVATQFPQSPANAQARLALARFNVEL